MELNFTHGVREYTVHGVNGKAVTLRMYTHADAESMKRASQIFRDALKKAVQ